MTVLEDIESLLRRWRDSGTSVDDIVSEVEAVLRDLEEESRANEPDSAFLR